MTYTKANDKLLSVTIKEILDRLSRLETHIMHLENRMDLIISENSRRDRVNNRPATTSSQMKILKFLRNNPQGSTNKEIQAATDLAKSTVSVGLKSLMNIGTVERMPSLRSDSRYKYVLAQEIPPEIKRMMELLGVESQRGT